MSKEESDKQTKKILNTENNLVATRGKIGEGIGKIDKAD